MTVRRVDILTAAAVRRVAGERRVPPWTSEPGADEPGLEDPAEANDPEPARPNTSFSDIFGMLEKVEEYMQWSIDVHDSDFDFLKALRNKLQRAHISGKKQSSLPFPAVARP